MQREWYVYVSPCGLVNHTLPGTARKAHPEVIRSGLLLGVQFPEVSNEGYCRLFRCHSLSASSLQASLSVGPTYSCPCRCSVICIGLMPFGLRATRNKQLHPSGAFRFLYECFLPLHPSHFLLLDATGSCGTSATTSDPPRLAFDFLRLDHVRSVFAGRRMATVQTPGHKRGYQVRTHLSEPGYCIFSLVILSALDMGARSRLHSVRWSWP